MKNNIVFFYFYISLSMTLLSQAQQVYIEGGVSTASFKNYTNSTGENTLTTNYTKIASPFIEGGIHLPLYRNKVKWTLGINYSNYIINPSFYAGNNTIIPTRYDLSYVALKTGIDFSIFKWKKFSIQIHSHISYDWLVFGSNEYRDVKVDLHKEGTFDKTLLRFHRGANIYFNINKKIITYINYNIGRSFKEKNKDSNNGESYNLETKSTSIGLIFNIQSK